MRRKPYGYFSKMSNDTLLQYVRDNYRGRTVGEFSIRDSQAYYFARKKGLVRGLVDEGTLSATRRGLFSKMNDEEFMEYLHKNHLGKRILDLVEQDRIVYDIARKRGLVGRLVADGTLRKLKRRGTFNKMTDDQFINYLNEKHNGASLVALRRADPYVHDQVYGRNLLDKLIDKGILTARRRESLPSSEDLERILQGYVGS